MWWKRSPAGHSPSPWPRRACRSRTTRNRRRAVRPSQAAGRRRWGPAQRRLGADEIALRWAVWREQVEDGSTFVDPGALPHAGVQRALAEARAYVAAPPPPGRIRSAFAAGEARTLRVDGPGWSMVARTDDIAFVLLDDQPGEILPVGRGPELPGLLRSLEALAVRPA
ncbi:hypothetical protein SRIMM317S_01295 [Streptomyces rimosus subsp. rimosus]